MKKNKMIYFIIFIILIILTVFFLYKQEMEKKNTYLYHVTLKTENKRVQQEIIDEVKDFQQSLNDSGLYYTGYVNPKNNKIEFIIVNKKKNKEIIVKYIKNLKEVKNVEDEIDDSPIG